MAKSKEELEEVFADLHAICGVEISEEDKKKILDEWAKPPKNPVVRVEIESKCIKAESVALRLSATTEKRIELVLIDRAALEEIIEAVKVSVTRQSDILLSRDRLPRLLNWLEELRARRDRDLGPQP